MGNYVKNDIEFFVKDKNHRRLALLQFIPDCDCYFLSRLPACSLGDYFFVMGQLEQLGIKFYECKPNN